MLDPLPPLPSRPSTVDTSLHDKVAENEMSSNPLDLDPLPLDTDQPLRDDDDNDRAKCWTHPTLTDDS